MTWITPDLMVELIRKNPKYKTILEKIIKENKKTSVVLYTIDGGLYKKLKK